MVKRRSQIGTRVKSITLKCPNCEKPLPALSLIKDKIVCNGCGRKLLPEKAKVTMGALLLSGVTVVGLNISLVMTMIVDIFLVVMFLRFIPFSVEE